MQGNNDDKLIEGADGCYDIEMEFCVNSSLIFIPLCAVTSARNAVVTVNYHARDPFAVACLLHAQRSFIYRLASLHGVRIGYRLVQSNSFCLF